MEKQGFPRVILPVESHSPSGLGLLERPGSAGTQFEVKASDNVLNDMKPSIMVFGLDYE
jgi:hypothetical protein